MESRGSLAWYSVLRFLPLLVSTGGTLVLAATLGISQFGAYSAALAVTQIVTSVGLVGQEQLVLQGVLRFRTALLRAALTVLVTGLLASAAGFVLLDPSLRGLVAPVVASAVLIQFCSILFAYMLLWEAGQRRAVAELGLRVTYQAGLNGGALVGGAAVSTALAGLVGAALGWCAVLASSLRTRRHRQPPKATHADAPWRRGAAFGIDATIYSLGLTVPLLVIAGTQSEEVNAQARLVLLCYTALVAISRSLTGEIYRVHLYRADTAGDRARLWRTVRKTLVVYAAIATAGLIAAAVGIPLILGDDYAITGIAIAILAAGASLQFAGYGMTALAVTNGHVRASVIRNCATLSIALVASLSLSLNAITLALIYVINDAVTTTYFWILNRRWGLTHPQGGDMT